METDRESSSPEAKSLQSSKPSYFARAKSCFENFRRKYEKYTELAIFGVGFIWDSFTMVRVDNPIDNIILLFYLAVIGSMIVVTLKRQNGAVLPQWIEKNESRLLWAMQFCFGGLFSSYVIFYFKSASWTRTQFFFLILIVLWIGNEFLRNRMRNAKLLSVLYCFCLFSFLAFFLPVILAKVTDGIFVLAGFISLFVSLSVFSIGMKAERQLWLRRMKPIASWIVITFFTVNLLYFTNLIPPVPLALKSAGIYHQVSKTKDGYYRVKYVPPSWLHFWRKWDDPFYLSPGESIYCYTAVFAPRGVHILLYHVWSHKGARGWEQPDPIPFPITGGRDGGYRGYTRKSMVAPGQWRVEVMTDKGRILGQINFEAVASPTPHPHLETMLIR